jgi:hypothetical protein
MKTAHRKSSHAKMRYRADPMAIFKVINRLEPFTPDELMRLELPIRMSFEAIKTGRGTLQDISDIGVAINTTMVRAEAIDPLCLQTAIAARDALLRCLHRYNATGKVGFDGPAIADVELGIDLHEQLLRLSTPVQMADALREVMRRTSQMEVLQ